MQKISKGQVVWVQNNAGEKWHRYEKPCWWMFAFAPAELTVSISSFSVENFKDVNIFEATQIGSLSAVNNSICSLVCLFLTLKPCQRDFFKCHSPVSASLTALLSISAASKTCPLWTSTRKTLPWCGVEKLFIYVLSGRFWCLLPCFYSFGLSSCFFPNSVQLLTRKGCIYFLIYAFVTIQTFATAALLAVILDNQFVSTGFVLIVCDVKCKRSVYGTYLLILFWKAIYHLRWLSCIVKLTHQALCSACCFVRLYSFLLCNTIDKILFSSILMFFFEFVENVQID